jgi:nicotinate-nucleotide--dimethylbenzimidazole phosphoribosyltransferase
VTDLLALGAEVRGTDAEAATAARAHARPSIGRLADLAEWLAATTGAYPPPRPGRVRMAIIGSGTASAAALADDAAVGLVGLRDLAPDDDGFAAGVRAADDEVDGGADLLVLAARDATPAAAVAVGLLTNAEPVALLPRGAQAVDSRAWTEQAVRLRDARRSVASLRHSPAELLDTLDSPALALATGFLLRSVTRRTPVLLDGAAALAAGLICYDVQPRAAQWWRVSDSSADPVHARAAEHLLQQPILGLGASSGDGVAGLLAVTVVRTAAALARVGSDDE